MKSHWEESQTNRVSTGGEPGNDKIRGGIEPLGVEAFKRWIKEGGRLYCYKSRRRDGDEVILEEVPVIKPHGRAVTMAYHGIRGNTYETSMTWDETIQLNRITQKQLARELTRTRKEMGITRPSDGCPEEIKVPGRRRINRKEYTGRIITLRNMGVTYVQTSCLVGISANAVREIYVEETKQNI